MGSGRHQANNPKQDASAPARKARGQGPGRTVGRNGHSRVTDALEALPPEQLVFHGRARLGFTIVSLCFLTLLGRAWYVQWYSHPKWKELAAQSDKQKEVLPAARGTIFDVNRRTLAYDELFYTLSFDNYVVRARETSPKEQKDGKDRMLALAKVLEKVEGRPAREISAAWSPPELQQRYLNWMLGLLGPAVGKTPAELQAEIANRRDTRYDEGKTVLARDLTVVQHEALLRLKEDYSLLGLTLDGQFKRVNPMPLDASHLVGYVRYAGPTNGVEYGRDKDLKGTDGFRESEVTPDGKEMPGTVSQVVPPVPGNSVRLAFDYDLQQIMHETMNERGKNPQEVYVPDLACERSVVLLLDAKTLALRSAVCRNKDDKPGLPPFNMAFNGCWDPGSIMKIITLAGALDTGKVSPNTPVATYSGYYDDDTIDPIIDEGGGWEELSVHDIMVHSSNIGAYQMARTVGARDWGALLKSFRLGEKTGIRCGAETGGIMPKDTHWNNNTFARTSYGYSVSVTPLQMASAMGAILNDGIYRSPYLVEEVTNHQGAVLSRQQPTAGERVVSSKTANQIKEMLFDAVERGSGKNAQSSRYWMAGKTATAKYATPNNDRKDGESATEYKPGDYAVSFLGYAPADDPKLIGIVVLILPRTDKPLYGGALAAPVFRRCMERALQYYGVPVQEISRGRSQISQR